MVDVKITLTPGDDGGDPESETVAVSRVVIGDDEAVLHGLDPADTRLLSAPTADLFWASGSFDDPRTNRSYQKFPCVTVPTDGDDDEVTLSVEVQGTTHWKKDGSI